MIFIFADFVGNAIEQLHELPVIRFGVRDADSARYWWPRLAHFFEFGERHVISSTCLRRIPDESTRGGCKSCSYYSAPRQSVELCCHQRQNQKLVRNFFR